MMLVEADAVITEPIHFLPGIEMFGVGPNGDVGLEISVRQRVGEFAANLEMVELFAVSEQIEDEYLHGRVPPTMLQSSLVEEITRKITAGSVVAPIDAIKFHICGIGGFTTPWQVEPPATDASTRLPQAASRRSELHLKT